MAEQQNISQEENHALRALIASVLSSADEGFICFNEKKEIVFANPYFARMVDIPLHEIQTKSLEDFFVLERLEDFFNDLVLSEGKQITLLCKTYTADAFAVYARCSRIEYGTGLYLLNIQPSSQDVCDTQKNERLLLELEQANKRLSALLKIVLSTLSMQDVKTFTLDVLQQLTEILQASGAVLYLAEEDGFRLYAHTKELVKQTIPTRLTYDQSLASHVMRTGAAVRFERVDMHQPSVASICHIRDEKTYETLEVHATHMPPFKSFLCVPVVVNNSVVALFTIGWFYLHIMRQEDALLLDAVAHYLSIEMMSLFSDIRAQRMEELCDAERCFHDELMEKEDPCAEDFIRALQKYAQVLHVEYVPVRYDDKHQRFFLDISSHVSHRYQIPFDLDAISLHYQEDGVAVVPFTAEDELGLWLASQNLSSQGAFINLSTCRSSQHAFFMLRPASAKPFSEAELTSLHTIADDICKTTIQATQRMHNTHISQALQNGMKNQLQKVDGLSAQGLYLSATASAYVGGDFYDLIRLAAHKSCVILGDVSGKGVEAASVSAAVKTALGAYAWENMPPAHMVSALNDFLLGFSRIETFATLFVGIIDLDEHTLTYCSAGHPPALLYRKKENKLEELNVQSGVVGAFSQMAYHDGVVSICENDNLFLYSDGVTEARNAQGMFFGEQQLKEALMAEEKCNKKENDLCDRILERLEVFSERKLDDDVAMVSIRFDTFFA